MALLSSADDSIEKAFAPNKVISKIELVAIIEILVNMLKTVIINTEHEENLKKISQRLFEP